jgi:multiple antibiotic resistance protein
MDRTAIIHFAIAMFAILNPVGNVAIFAGMVAGRSHAEQRLIGLKSSIAVGVILVSSVWVGEHVLDLFGIGIPELQVAGGIMIALISLSMLRSSQNAMHDSKNSQEEEDIAVVPLAMPMVAGPGAIVTVIVNTHQHVGVESNMVMSGICAFMAILIYACFMTAGPIAKVLKVKGMEILTKFMGMLLLAIAAGMLASGLKGLLPGLSG